VKDCGVLPLQRVIDYESRLSALPDGANAVQFLRDELPFRWRDLYVSSVAHPTNLVHFRFRTFEYICDLYSELEATGEVSYDQRIENRVVAVIGTSARAEEQRDASRSRGWVGPPEELLVTERDQGHFMAHCIGGGLDVNVFSQERRLNRGWSPQGKPFHQLPRETGIVGVIGIFRQQNC